MSILVTRLLEAMDDLGWDQSVLAGKLGITPGAISLIVRGKTQHSKHLPRIALELGVSYEWLIGKSPDKYGFTLTDEAVFPDERSLINRRRDLPLPDRLAFDRLAEALFATQDMTRDIAKYLPDERALTAMFEGMLDQVPDDIDQKERARLLAQWLPTSLSQLRDLRSVEQDDLDRKIASVEAPPIHDRESQS